MNVPEKLKDGSKHVVIHISFHLGADNLQPALRKSRINRLLRVYLSALAFLLVSVATSMVLTEMQATRLEADANDINVSGRQRMLSQRIIYLAQDLMTSFGEDAATTRAALLESIAEFEAVIVTFEQSHLALSQRPDLEPALRNLYFGQGDVASLDQRIRDYIHYARQIAADPADADSLRALKSIERQGLLRDLDAVVSRIEATSVARVGALRNFERYSLILAAVIVLAEVLLVFLPGTVSSKIHCAACRTRMPSLTPPARLSLPRMKNCWTRTRRSLRIAKACAPLGAKVKRCVRNRPILPIQFRMI